MIRELIRDALESKSPDRRITVAGWVRTRRDSKAGFSFIELNDGSSFENIQIIADASLENYESEILRLFPGASLSVSGTLVASAGSGQDLEVKADKIKVFGFCEPTEYPLQKSRVSFERLREIAHLRPRTNSFGAIARLRNALSFATHRFFQERNFFYVHTPIITANDCEGAGEMFQVTTLDIDAIAKSGNAVDYSKDFFGRKAHLTVSGQLNVETHACALSNVYTFGPTFRAENSNTRRHLAEFWMIEPEMAFADLADDADLAEDYLRYLIRYVLNNCQADLEFFNARIDKGLLKRLTPLAESTFTRITYTEAIKLLEDAPVSFEFTPSWGADLQAEHERYLTEKVCNGPVVVIDYPREIKAFYMHLNDDEKTVAAMDVLLPGIGEIIGGSQREARADLLESRIRDMGLDPQDYSWYLDLRRFGSVPHAGFGLGFERMMLFCSGMQNIRDVIPFPRTPNNADF